MLNNLEVLYMSKTILSIFRMFSYGLGSIQFVKKRDYGQAMSKNANQAAYERWLTLGQLRRAVYRCWAKSLWMHLLP